jgi:tetratricopeptide (TPR) repeat protein
VKRERQPRTRLVVLAAAVALAAAGGSATGLGAPAWLAGAVAAVAALVAGTVVDRIYRARDEGAAARERRRLVLDKLERTVQARHRDVLALLRADRSPMPFRGRSRELHQLVRWCAEESASPLLMLSGPSGVGKSRLALEFGLRLSREWATGWLHAGSGNDAVEAIRACGDRAVILVDDADGRADLLPLLESLAEEHESPAIRVVMVTRSATGLQAALSARLEERHTWIASGATELDLSPEGGRDDWIRWFGEAVRAFAEALDTPVPALAERFPQGSAAAAQPFVELQAQALLTVLSIGRDDPDPRDLPFRQVASALMSHEQHRWRTIAATWDWSGSGPPSTDIQERSVAALCLLGSDSDAETKEVLRRVPELRDATAERLSAVGSWIWALYPTGFGAAPRIRPDMIGEWFVVSQLTAHPDLARSLRTGLTDSQAARALGFLARAADRIDTAGQLFVDFGSGDFRRRIMGAALAAMTGKTGRRLLDAVIAEQLQSSGDWTLDQLTELRGLLPEDVLLLTHVTIADLLVTVYRSLAAADAAQQVALAEALSSLSISLYRVGRYREALAAGREAVTLRRALAVDDPAAHQVGLASALSNLGNWLGLLGRYREAVEATEESVALYRGLANDNSADHRVGLAAALSNLGNWLGELGRYKKAVDAAQEAVTLDRALAVDDPAAYQAGLATALSDIGNWLYQLGRHGEALEATEESVTLYRRLADDNSAAYQAHLAMALSNLGNRLSQVGQYREAVEAGQEAVGIRRALPADNLAGHRADLAMGLESLGLHLGGMGRYREAVDAARECVTLYRGLADDNSAAHRAHLAGALGNLGLHLGGMGSYREAVDAARECVTLYRGLADDNSAAHQAHLAGALSNLGLHLGGMGSYREALETTEECVTLYRGLADDNFAVHQAHLAGALGNLSTWLEELGRHLEALDARTELVRIYGSLASRSPDLYQVEYRRKLAALRREYDQRGMRYEAMTHDLVDPAD